MKVFRICGLLAVFTCIAVTLVWIRAEQARSAAGALALEARWIELRRELWSIQTHVARLRTPEQVRRRVARFDAGLVPPTSKDKG